MDPGNCQFLWSCRLPVFLHFCMEKTSAVLDYLVQFAVELGPESFSDDPKNFS